MRSHVRTIIFHLHIPFRRGDFTSVRKYGSHVSRCNTLAHRSFHLHDQPFSNGDISDVLLSCKRTNHTFHDSVVLNACVATNLGIIFTYCYTSCVNQQNKQESMIKYDSIMSDLSVRAWSSASEQRPIDRNSCSHFQCQDL